MSSPVFSQSAAPTQQLDLPSDFGARWARMLTLSRLSGSQCRRVNAGSVQLADLDKSQPTIKNTVVTGAILEAGRRSLDEKRSVEIKKVGEEWTLV